MTPERATVLINAEGILRHVDDAFQAMYRNICDAYGGEEKIPPFHLANIRGGLTRAKSFALIPAQEIIHGEKAPADSEPVSTPGGFRV